MEIRNPLVTAAERKLLFTWYIFMPGLPVAAIVVFIALRALGWLSSEPLPATQSVSVWKIALPIAFFLGLLLVWNDYRRLFTVSSLMQRPLPSLDAPGLPSEVRFAGSEVAQRWMLVQRIKLRCFTVLGHFNANAAMLVVLYLVMRTNWILAATAFYSIAAGWYFRPRPVALVEAAMASLTTK